MGDNLLKRCCSCGKLFEIDNFYKNITTKDYLDAICKSCRSRYSKEYRDSRKHKFIYMIHEGKRATYIGSTVDLSTRISQHLNYHSHLKNYMKSNKWTEIKYISVDEDITERELRYLEQIFIEEICPILNHVSNSNFEDIEDDRLEYLTEVAYNSLEGLDAFCKTYKTNYSNI